MAAHMRKCFHLSKLVNFNKNLTKIEYFSILKNYSTTENTPEKENAEEGSAKPRFKEAYDKFEKMTSPVDTTPQQPPEVSFPSMLRKSKFVQIGDPEGRVVVGKIVEALGDDLYIDFGGKFYCVCPRPKKNEEEYIRGALVRIRLHEMEMSTRLLGTTTDMTALEADATLLGLHKPKSTSSARTTVE